MYWLTRPHGSHWLVAEPAAKMLTLIPHSKGLYWTAGCLGSVVEINLPTTDVAGAKKAAQEWLIDVLQSFREQLHKPVPEL